MEQDKKDIRQEPFSLPTGFSWGTLDLNDEAQVSNVAVEFSLKNSIFRAGLGLFKMVVEGLLMKELKRLYHINDKRLFCRLCTKCLLFYYYCSTYFF